MKSVSRIIFSIGVVGLVSACGPMNSANPTRGYKDLETVPPHDKILVTQGAPTEVVTWSIIDESGEPVSPLSWKGNFVVGQQKTFKVSLTSNLPSVSFDLSADKLPVGMTPPVETGTPGVWSMSWTPTGATIPDGRTSHSDEFELQATPHSNIPGDLAAINAGSRLTIPVQWNVDGVVGKPKIDTVTVNEEINQDQQGKLTISVTDPSSSEGNRPQISWDTPPAAGSDTYEFNGNGLLNQDPANPPALIDEKSGKWTFTFNVDPRSYKFPEASATGGKNLGSATARINFHVVGANGGQSGGDTRTFKIVRSAQVAAPRIDFGSDSVTFLAGKDNSLKIFATGNSGDDEVAIDGKALQAQIKDWPGAPSVNCMDSSETGKGRSQCTLSWKIPCADANLKQSYSFSVQAVNSAYERSERKSEDKAIRVEKNEAYCPSPKATNGSLDPLKVSKGPQVAPKPTPEDLRGPNTPAHVEFKQTGRPKPRPASPGAKP